ncbi:MAG: 4'-phosphopantetheinyl transferase superfamily protein [Deltaproteobacteria bacterium]|nr:4'-phosphopantetheinyl transferase superfamily protein [Deltaproteobacteria bacterium]
MRILAKGDVDLHIFNDTKAQNPQVNKVLLTKATALLSISETDQLQSISHPNVRRQFIISRAWLRLTLSSYCSVHPCDLHFLVTKHGRPEISKTKAMPPLRFNLSHTSGMLALAVTNRNDIGIDIEWLGRKIDLTNMTNRFLAICEAQDVLKLGEEEQKKRFLTYWTLKEAYFKARGLGITLSLKNVIFTFANKEISVNFTSDIEDCHKNWQFSCLYPSLEHVLALAVKSSDTPMVASNNYVSNFETLLKNLHEI